MTEDEAFRCIACEHSRLVSRREYYAERLQLVIKCLKIGKCEKERRESQTS